MNPLETIAPAVLTHAYGTANVSDPGYTTVAIGDHHAGNQADSWSVEARGMRIPRAL